MNLDTAVAIIDASLAEARAKSYMKMAVAVLDPGGHLVAFKREDGAGIVRYEIAFAKAWGSLGLGMGTRAIAGAAEKMPTFFGHLGAVSGGRMAASPGGVLIADAEGTILGAVGISGDLGPADEECVIAGIKSVGLIAYPGFPGQPA